MIRSALQIDYAGVIELTSRVVDPGIDPSGRPSWIGMSGSTETLSRTLDAVRERTFSLFAPLSAADMNRTPDPIMSPPVWDLGHIAAYEELWLLCTLTGAAPLHPELQAAYDAFETPRATRTSIRLLDEDACREYLGTVRDRAQEALASTDLADETNALTRDGFVFAMVAAHEAQHTETVLQALQMYEDSSYRPPQRRMPPTPEPIDNVRIALSSGTVPIGAPDSRFAYDCERPRHERHVDAFAIDRLPVTNARHLAFIDDGGYERRELWSAEGWQWRGENDVTAPLYWRRDGDTWFTRSFDRILPVDPDRPVVHVSFHEAEAHARWAGGRLPTEAEWERAATNGDQRLPWGDGAATAHANVDQLAFGVAPVGAYPGGEAPSGCLGMIGDVWEWTATPFGGYPGFRAFPYREYAEVFFGHDYRVLRGGSWATQEIVASTTFRNWDHPQRRQIFSGFRLAWDED
jgi:iron(II)-dependent oxidoreductase